MMKEIIVRIPTRLATGVASLAAAATVVALVPGPVAAAPAAPGTASSVVSMSSQDRPPAGEYTSKVRGDFRRNGVVRGTFTPDRFFVKKGEVFAKGTLNATLRRGDGNLVGRTSREIVIPVRNATASASERRRCDILNLVLGPLDLNLLGLEVHLNRVVLDIVAVPGAGNLLGNLLCAVAGLLDGTGGLSLLERLRLANLLNRILGLLG